MKILIAIESETCAKSIARFMAEHYWGANTHFNVLKVLPPLRATAPYNLLPSPVLDDLEQETRAIAESFVKRVAGAILDELHTEHVDWQLRDGFIAETILEAATEMQADLIVLGCGHRSHKSVFGLYGSVLGDVAAHAQCPVLVIRPPVEETCAEPCAPESEKATIGAPEKTAAPT